MIPDLEAGMIQVKYVIFRGHDFALFRLVLISGQHIAIEMETASC